MIQKSRAEVILGALIFFGIDRLVRLFGTGTDHEFNKEHFRCQIELLIITCIAVVILFNSL
jgi:hypothetical protein